MVVIGPLKRSVIGPCLLRQSENLCLKSFLKEAERLKGEEGNDKETDIKGLRELYDDKARC